MKYTTFYSEKKYFKKMLEKVAKDRTETLSNL